jgi:protein phosphatase
MRPAFASGPAWRAAGRQGARKVNADAVASYALPGESRMAFALADGVGDNVAAARAARLAASVAVRAGVEDPVAAVLAAQQAVRSDETLGDCVLVVALPLPESEGYGYRIAWVGDARAYHWTGDTLVQLTTDHTIAQYFHEHGMRLAPALSHVVTTSVRQSTPDQIGSTEIHDPLALVFTSDGVHGPLAAAAMTDVLRLRPRPAAALAEAAITAGGTDNATAMIIHRPEPVTTPITIAA